MSASLVAPTPLRRAVRVAAPAKARGGDTPGDGSFVLLFPVWRRALAHVPPTRAGPTRTLHLAACAF
jgi:hypothetical protein